MTISDLNGLFTHLLQDMYYAEHKIAKTLPKMAKQATNDDLKEAFESHLEETREQIEILEQVFEVTGIEKDTEKCDAIEGLLKEGDSLIKECEEGSVLDAALIAAAQKVEHYEMASYGALCNIAKILGENEAAKLLHKIFDQEKAADEKLSDMADSIEEEAMAKAA